MRQASVVVIGGGAVGASVAYHLASRGWKDVLVLDRGAPGEGSTGRATGGFRAQFGTPINVRLSLLSRARLLRFAEETGTDPGYLAAGYLWLAEAEDDLASLRSALAMQRAEGLDEAVEVSPEDVARINPAVRLDAVVGGTFCPSDGFIRPLRLLEGYTRAAERLGVCFEYGLEATGLTLGADGSIAAVETSSGSIAVGAVVNAAGPWAAVVAAWAGVDLPVAPLRRQVAATEPCDLLPERMPMTIFAGDGFHLRVRDGRVLLLWPTPGVPGDAWSVTVEAEWVGAVVGKAWRRVPMLRGVGIDTGACWAGLYEQTPDKHAVLGVAPGCPNLFLANGSSGHGVMHAPALGQLLVELMSEGRTSLDIAPLRPERFAEGEPNPLIGLL
jgi:sarcosine oxidase subunit beta